MKTLIKAIVFGTVAASTFEVLRRTKVLEKAADLMMDKLIHISMEDSTEDAVVPDGMFR